MFLALLGFTSCEKEQATEYGMPHARYEIKGKVWNAAGEAVPGMGVLATEHYPLPEAVFGQMAEEIVYTDINGEFVVIQESSHNRFRMYLLDKVENPPGYEAVDSVDVDFEQVALEGGKGWYVGSATQHVNVRLAEK